MKVGVESLARQLRSRVRDEFIGPTPSARERVEYISAATARHTTRDPMVLARPLSSLTGAILTNVPLPTRTPPVGRESPPLVRFGEAEGGIGGGGCGGNRGERNSAGAFW